MCGRCETTGAIAIAEAGMTGAAGTREAAAEMKEMVGLWIFLEDGSDTFADRFDVGNDRS